MISVASMDANVLSGAFPRAALAALILGAAVGLAACTSELPAPPASTPDSSSDQGTSPEEPAAGQPSRASAVIAGESYAFELAVCLVQPDAVLASGGGVDSAGDPAYLDLDLVIDGNTEFGAARIELGTDQPFDSRETFLAASVGSGDAYTLTIDGSRVSLEATFRDASGAPVGDGTVSADCG